MNLEISNGSEAVVRGTLFRDPAALPSLGKG
jgi:hypothetical protein